MKPVVMHNILGPDDGYVGPYRFEGLLRPRPWVPGRTYTGRRRRDPRKMGHLSIVGERLNAVEEMDKLVDRGECVR